MKLSRISGLVTGLYVILFALFLNAPAFAAETYNLDKGHTDIRFGWNHAGVSDQSGRFNDFEGQLILNEEDPTKSSLNVTIKTNSLSTGVERLDAHLKNADFFEVTKFPNITFTSKRIVRTGKSLASVIGDLTIRGVTKPVTLDVELMHKGKHPLGQFIEYYKGEWLGFKGWIPVRSATLSSKPDLNIFSKVGDDGFDRGFEAEALSWC